MYIFQLDKFNHGFLLRNSGKDGRYLPVKNTVPSSRCHHSVMVWQYPVDLFFLKRQQNLDNNLLADNTHLGLGLITTHFSISIDFIIFL